MNDEARWRKVGIALRAERGGRSREAIDQASGVSERSIADYERGKVFDEFPGKMIQLAAFYGWAPEALGDVFDGGRVTYAGGRSPGVAAPDAGVRKYEVGASEHDETEMAARQVLRLIPDLLGGVEALGAVEVLRQILLLVSMLDPETGEERITLSSDDPWRERVVQQMKARSRPGGGVNLILSIDEPHVLLVAGPHAGDPLLVVNPILDELPEFFRKDPQIRSDYENAMGRRPLTSISDEDPPPNEISVARNDQPDTEDQGDGGV